MQLCHFLRIKIYIYFIPHTYFLGTNMQLDAIGSAEEICGVVFRSKMLQHVGELLSQAAAAS